MTNNQTASDSIAANQKELKTEYQNLHAKLMKKMAKVITLTGNVKKKGMNREQNYKFAQHSDIIEELRTHIAEQGLFILPMPDFFNTDPIVSRSGSHGSLVTMKMKFRISDTETGYSIMVDWYGQGMDYGDKAMYKAYTGALKYFLLDTFMISTGDDPENESPEGQRKAAAQAPALQREAPAPLPMRKDQLAQIAQFLEIKGKTESDLLAYAQKAFKLDDWHKMNAVQANTIVKKLALLPDLQTDPALDVDEIDEGIEKQRLEFARGGAGTGATGGAGGNTDGGGAGGAGA